MRIVALLAALALAGCALGLPGAARPDRPERIAIDSELSPVPFRWLDDGSVLVAHKTGSRSLARFGNYLDRSARPQTRARLAIWDDEAAWRRWRESDGSDAGPLAHKRAEFLKEPEPTPVEEFTVFDARGRVVYERDFRDWPLAATEE